MSVVAFAGELLELDGGIAPKVAAECPYGNGIHDMVRWGSGYLMEGQQGASGNVTHFYGPCYQCQKCYTVMLTEYDAVGYNAFGKYGMASYDQPIIMTGVNIYTKSIKVKTGNTPLQGFSFRNSY